MKLQNQRAVALTLFFAFALSGCGGGGSTPTAGTPTTGNPPATTDSSKDDTPVAPAAAPTRQDGPMETATAVMSMLTPTTVTVANSLIPTAGRGAKDPYFMAGGGYVGDVRNDARGVYSQGITAFGKRIEGNSFRSAALEVPNPPRDVRTAWREGWTGQGVNILIADGFGRPGSALGGTHGYTVGMSALEIAPGATYYGLEVGINPFDAYLRGGLRNSDNVVVTSNTEIDVINLSFGSDPISLPTTEAAITARIAELSTDAVWDDVLGGVYLTNADDAVITKAAGNESTDAALPLENLALVLDDHTKSRILIVGALDRYAQNGNARLSGYSNHAGVATPLQDRFLVEYGGSPYDTSAYLCDASTPANIGCRNLQFLGDVSDEGTSYAAPRVAGHAALVRHKFPGLSGAQTAKILLDTATTAGIACHPSCDVEIYGQGRVSIADALSPIGKLQ